MTVVVGGANQHHKNKHLDVENGEGIGVDGNVLSLVGVEGGHAIHNHLLVGHLDLTLDAEALGSGSLLGLALALEAKLLLGFSF